MALGSFPLELLVADLHC